MKLEILPDADAVAVEAATRVASEARAAAGEARIAGDIEDALAHVVAHGSTHDALVLRQPAPEMGLHPQPPRAVRKAESCSG
jgi:hypothetical protein